MRFDYLYQLKQRETLLIGQSVTPQTLNVPLLSYPSLKGGPCLLFMQIRYDTRNRNMCNFAHLSVYSRPQKVQDISSQQYKGISNK